MPNLIRVLMLVAVCATLASCQRSQTAEVKSAIRQLAAADKRIGAEVTLEKLRRYAGELSLVDVSNCPQEFIAAWDRHLAAVEAVHLTELNRPSQAEAALVGFAAGYSGRWDAAAYSLAQELANSRQVYAELDAARAHLANVSVQCMSR